MKLFASSLQSIIYIKSKNKQQQKLKNNSVTFQKGAIRVSEAKKNKKQLFKSTNKLVASITRLSSNNQQSNKMRQ